MNSPATKQVLSLREDAFHLYKLAETFTRVSDRESLKQLASRMVDQALSIAIVEERRRHSRLAGEAVSSNARS